MPAPTRLRADNFTPATRTPWGGTRILSHYKSDLGIVAQPIVGESWEVSVEPSFPSRTESGALLADLIAGDPMTWLGARDRERYGQCPLLVKLLDAKQNLSVQVHPADDDTALQNDESGKPESWVVLDAEPGAGLYLGFGDGVTRQDVESCLEKRGSLEQLMTFVPVAPGDAFVIEAGTPHAIGAGVTLLEPQHVTPGRRGLTYRFWDWNRLYDGRARELHVERSLAVTRWDAPRGNAFVDTCRARSEVLESDGLRRERVVNWRWFEVERWAGTGTLHTTTNDRLMALTCVAGKARIACGPHRIDIQRGQSAVVPARGEDGGDVVIEGESVEIFSTTTS